ncbi:dephospho-CoA kinase [Lactiplantibacillus sp. WILCCON 0030]|uniref:Dephospho-CoA kinase n=1 Tax=Lactiplantibacillus brownii TaxID=3069269 RepID=A0ABU1A9T3_9LACO|nr:dephospho-CoA kinase [Lactiplantibacillus brownii]MDQ7937188.1 dephospho-CoA kinase [Lactiplantibacillus brownii]
MTQIIGLTGGIATGKSTVSAMLAEAGLPIVDADKIAWQVEGAGQPTTQKIAAAFGSQTLLADGQLNRRWLGQQVFNDASKLALLTEITRGPIQRAMLTAIVAAGKSQPAAVILDVPLLFEGGWQHICDQVVVVAAPAPVVLSRLMARNQLSAEAARARIASQMPLAEKVQRADVVIDNGENVDKTRTAVLKWLKTIIK